MHHSGGVVFLERRFFAQAFEIHIGINSFEKFCASIYCDGFSVITSHIMKKNQNVYHKKESILQGNGRLISRAFY